MSLNHLLLWLSAKGHGSWSQFRGAVESLCVERDDGPELPDDLDRAGARGSDLPVYQQHRFALQRLAHVEFFSKEQDHDWRVVPPVIALFPSSLQEGVLCGARSPELLEGLDRFDDLNVVRTGAPDMPERIVVRGISQAVGRDLSQRGVLVQPDTATTLLSALPLVRDPAAWHRAAIPETQGWTVHRFSSSRLKWTESMATHAKKTWTALFRFVRKHQRFYYLRWHGQTYRVPVQVGKYAVATKTRGLVSYDAATQTLSVPVSCRPPLLIERALILCSGVLPALQGQSRRLRYTGVPPHVARLTAQLLLREAI